MNIIITEMIEQERKQEVAADTEYAGENKGLKLWRQYPDRISIHMLKIRPNCSARLNPCSDPERNLLVGPLPRLPLLKIYKYIF